MVRLLYAGCTEPAIFRAVSSARGAATTFRLHSSDYSDLDDLACHLLANSTLPPEAHEPAHTVRTLLATDGPVVRTNLALHRSEPSGDPQPLDAGGLSIYFPVGGLASRKEDLYGRLAFAADTQWDEFLIHYGVVAKAYDTRRSLPRWADCERSDPDRYWKRNTDE